MYWFLRVNKNTFKMMPKKDMEDFAQQDVFSDVDKQIIKCLCLGQDTQRIMLLTNLTKNELHRHYEFIAKQAQKLR